MQTFNIGRDAGNQIVLNDSLVSRHHALLTLSDNGQVMIKDLGSSNGTFVNGNKITECYLNTGDVVKCGSVFLNWSQYVNNKSTSGTPAINFSYQQEASIQNSGQHGFEYNSSQLVSLSETLKYLTTRIFDVGDLFKSEGDKKPTILFFLLTPVVLMLGILLYFYFQFQFSFLYQVLLPWFTSFLIFGAAQFLTLSLLSIHKKVMTLRILLAASIYSFLQFLFYVFIIFGFTLNVSSSYSFNYYNNSFAGIFFLNLLILTIVISLSISWLIFIFKYFRSIGFSKGISIHFTIFSFALNLLIQAALLYLLIVIAGNNFIHL